MELPFVTCITPTTASRNCYLPLLLRSFLQQDHQGEKELIVVSEDAIPLPSHPNIRLVKCEPGLTIGAKRNIACENARGSICGHWDSDDWSAPGRLTEMVKLMKKTRKKVIGYGAITFWNEARDLAYRSPMGNGLWACGTSLVYTREFWASHRFPNTQTGEDSAFIQQARDAKTLHAINGWDRMTALDHPDNSWVRPVKWPNAQIVPSQTIRDILYPPKPHKILLALLSWNTLEISRDSCQALILEKTRLEAAGYLAEVVVCDNGSNDGSQEYWQTLAGVKVIQNQTNLGSSVARNQIIDHALSTGVDSLLFTDGDLEIVPWSVLGMAQWLQTHPKAGCIGAWSENYTDVREKASPYWVQPIVGVPARLVFWSQYGLVNRECFSKVRFDEAFGPGWGAEDNDFAYQMIHNHGMIPHHFNGMTYLHRSCHSSATNLVRDGHDVRKLYDERMKYIRHKWAHVPEITNALRGITWCPTPN